MKQLEMISEAKQFDTPPGGHQDMGANLNIPCTLREKSALENLAGQRFGSLTVQSYLGQRLCGEGFQKRATWLCLCDCGNTTAVTKRNLKRKKKVSCGCLQTKINKARKLTAIQKYFDQYARSAEGRRFSFDLTLGQFEQIVVRNCAYCGKQPTVRTTLGTSINCAPSCTQCNRAKNNLSIEDWNSWLSRLTQFQASKYAKQN